MAAAIFRVALGVEADLASVAGQKGASLETEWPVFAANAIIF
jgi:hypothetical protein